MKKLLITLVLLLSLPTLANAEESLVYESDDYTITINDIKLIPSEDLVLFTSTFENHSEYDFEPLGEFDYRISVEQVSEGYEERLKLNDEYILHDDTLKTNATKEIRQNESTEFTAAYELLNGNELIVRNSPTTFFGKPGEIFSKKYKLTELEGGENLSLTPESIFESSAKRIYGDDLTTFNDDNGNIVIGSKLNNLTSGMMLRGFKYDVVDYLELIQDEDYVDVYIGGNAILVDAYGNETEENVAFVIFDKATVDQINFDNFDIDNLEVIADAYFEHSAFNQ